MCVHERARILVSVCAHLCGVFLRACTFARVSCVCTRVWCACVCVCAYIHARARVAGLGVLGDGAQAGGEGEGVPEDDGLTAEVQEMRHILSSWARGRLEGRGREVGVSKPCIGHTCMYALAEKMRHILPYRARQCVCMWGIILKEIALGYIVHIRRRGGRGPAGARGPAIKGPWEGGSKIHVYDIYRCSS